MRKFWLLVCSASIVGVALPAYVEHNEAQKAVLITGATTRIGRMAGEHLAANGYFVYAGARQDQDIEELNQIDFRAGNEDAWDEIMD